MGYYIHHTPGRLRVKSPVIKNNKEAAEDAEKLLSQLQGVDNLYINLKTGSILVNYNSRKLKRSQIVNKLQNAGYFLYSEATTNDQYFMHTSIKFLQMLAYFI